MNTRDLNPLYRTLVGFDRISSLLDQAARLDQGQGYPPFNIEQTGDDDFRIELAVAGFTQDELTIEFKEQQLTVSGKKAPVEEARRFLHRGIAERNFSRTFTLADHVRVHGARLENGMLTVELVRVLPEALKPRTIAIETGAAKPVEKKVNPKTIEGEAANAA
jgi:molecular chaperone IbpA